MLPTSCSILSISHQERTMAILDSRMTAPTAGPLPHALARAIEQWTPVSGRHATSWPGLEFVRADSPRPRAPVVMEPCLCIVAQGRKRAYLGGDAFTYDPLHYLVVAVPLPIETEIIQATPGQPYPALLLRLQTTTISEILLEMDGTAGRIDRGGPGRGMYTSPLSAALYGAVLRLVGTLSDPTERRVLAPMAEREVVYHLLVGEQGSLLQALAFQDSHAHRIAQVLRFLHEHYERPLDVATMARVANMSPSTLHHTFREVTNSSPLQYLKRIRLHRARLLMLHDGLGVGEAAHQVGYGSDSQFSREYRRYFGVPPSVDAAAHRADASPRTRAKVF
jgi:AraC-like DNA-binding protein